MKKIIRFLGGPPGTGKTTYSERIVVKVQERCVAPVVVMDGDMFFTPIARVMKSVKTGIPLDTPEFTKLFNLPAQLRFQRLLRTAAEEGLVVIATAPFENMFGQVGGKPLWEKMQSEDFADFDIAMTYTLLVGDEHEVETAINKRLRSRAKASVWHQLLDVTKIADPAYYSKRAALVRKSVETFGFQLVESRIEEDPYSVADRIADAIIATL